VLVSALVGLIVSFLQAITSIQDVSIGHGIKLLAVVGALVLAAPWASASLLRFTKDIIAIGIPS
jgi:type III secretion protein S